MAPCVKLLVRDAFRNLSSSSQQAKSAVVVRFVMSYPGVLAAYAAQNQNPVEAVANDGAPPPASLGCLGTWNGRWLMQDAAVLATCAAAKDCEEAGKDLASLPTVKALFAEFQEFALEKQAAVGFDHFSCQLELTPEAFREGRMHFHMFWSFRNSTESGRSKKWAFRGSEPLLVPNAQRGNNLRAVRANNRGHYYCQADKIGHVLRYTTLPKHSKLLVMVPWIQELNALGKLSEDAFLGECLGARGRAKALIEDLRWQSSLLRERDMLQRAKAARAAFAASARPFRRIGAVEEWRRQYLPPEAGGDGIPRLRFKFLVLCGPSRLGKSLFGASLFPPCHQCFCLGQAEPDLRLYRDEYHKSICLEEIEPAMVLGNKLLFQSSDQIVSVAQSKCQQHAFSVFLYKVPLICMSNDWTRKMSELDVEAQEWLEANSVLVRVTEPLWEQ